MTKENHVDEVASSQRKTYTPEAPLELSPDTAPAPSSVTWLGPPKPRRGSIVDFTEKDGGVFPALVVDVDLTQPYVCGLFVFKMAGGGVADAVAYYDGPDAEKTLGTWRWAGRA